MGFVKLEDDCSLIHQESEISALLNQHLLYYIFVGLWYLLANVLEGDKGTNIPLPEDDCGQKSTHFPLQPACHFYIYFLTVIRGIFEKMGGLHILFTFLYRLHQSFHNIPDIVCALALG